MSNQISNLTYFLFVCWFRFVQCVVCTVHARRDVCLTSIDELLIECWHKVELFICSACWTVVGVLFYAVIAKNRRRLGYETSDVYVRVCVVGAIHTIFEREVLMRNA